MSEYVPNDSVGTIKITHALKIVHGYTLVGLTGEGYCLVDYERVLDCYDD